MSDGTKNICMVRGDTLAFGIEIDGLEQDLDTVFFTCKANYDDTDANAVFKKSLGTGIEKVSDGKCRNAGCPGLIRQPRVPTGTGLCMLSEIERNMG